MSQLTEHFSLEELTASATAHARGIHNVPGPEQVTNLLRLAGELEKIRQVLGDVPLHLESGYRCPELNRAVGGQPTSYHLDGCAADFHPPAPWTHDQAQHAIGAALDISVDLIMEEGTVDGAHRWLHFQIPRPGQTPRRIVRDAAVASLGGPILHTSAG